MNQRTKEEFIGYLAKPQQWNRYVYVTNNPLLYIDTTGAKLEITGDIAAAFSRIRTLVGAAKELLYTYTENGHTYIDFKGSHLDDWKNVNALVQADAGGINVYMAKIMSSKEVIEYAVAESFDTKFRKGIQTGGGDCGGACTVGAEESLTGNTQIFVNPYASAIAEEKFNTPALRIKFTPTQGKVWAENDVVDAHEFGHAFANAFKGKRINRSDETDRWAVDFENLQRDTYSNDPHKIRFRRIIE